MWLTHFWINICLNKGAVLLTDHYLVVRWIRRWDCVRQTWKNAVRLNWEHLVEALCPVAFTSHVWKNFLHITEDFGFLKSKWALFKASIVEAAAKSRGQKVSSACCGGNLRTHRCTLAMKEAVKIKRKAFRFFLTRGSSEETEGYREPRRAVAVAALTSGIFKWWILSWFSAFLLSHTISNATTDIIQYCTPRFLIVRRFSPNCAIPITTRSIYSLPTYMVNKQLPITKYVRKWSEKILSRYTTERLL